ncbi:short-chain fatty acid transporter [Mangrovimonas yunxiaonensis]|uniref:Short-chain fatty acid transporter n=1 Tax=Mangrovimonas yunxiaonensis TaxID=1197477 RepID=A0A084TLE2_9FLAO|nr:TIGR00366 family protein [Mangrovimonas yunxiaonensis]KFB01528.1 short-chain fatty acid transporter [Mangrovimonas yunxiaonensis]GGH36167.1 short-chain fatty acids transporter [Mangrovimonas yunxiaonensis]
MKLTKFIETTFKKYLPSPFTIAVLLTLLTIALALVLTTPEPNTPHVLQILSYWEAGVWNNNLLVFAYQMMLILVLGHVLVLSKPISKLISGITGYAQSTQKAVVLVSVTTMLVAFFNWGLGLIFGAILARKVGEHAQNNNIPLNYPLVGAAGYVGLMVWHGGISGSALIKVSETNHIKTFMGNIASPERLSQLPVSINFNQTVFSGANLLLFAILLFAVPLVLSRVAKKTAPTPLKLDSYKNASAQRQNLKGAERLDYSKGLSLGFGAIILIAFFYQYSNALKAFQITPNMLNFFMLGLGILLHGSFSSFLNALQEAIKGASGILIQFPLYFGIMGIMEQTGMVIMISDFFVSIANKTTLPIFTFFSAGLVNIFVPSGGGQWAVQGPIVIESALKLGVPLPKAIMALAYGDQITNMLQPFWALPLLGITKLKAKEILPYTLIMMGVGMVVFIGGLILL